MQTTGPVSVAGIGWANVVSNCVVLLTQWPRRVGAERELTFVKQHFTKRERSVAARVYIKECGRLGRYMNNVVRYVCMLR